MNENLLLHKTKHTISQFLSLSVLTIANKRDFYYCNNTLSLCNFNCTLNSSSIYNLTLKTK